MIRITYLILSVFLIFYISACGQKANQSEKKTTEKDNKTQTSYSDSTRNIDQELVGSEVDSNMLYLGQKPPQLIPEIFYPDFISLKNQYEFGSIFSEDAKEFFYSIAGPNGSYTLHSKLSKGVWTEPKIILSHESYGFNDPMLSPDEQRLYFISDRAIDGTGKKKDHDIWYVERQGGSWSQPISAGDQINSPRNEYYMSFTQNGRMYFSSNVEADSSQMYNFDIYYSDFVNGEFQSPQKLSNQVNTEQYEADVFVAPDESYLIFCGNRKDGYGEGDLYISFKDSVGNWTPAKNMGSSINDEKHQLCPFVSQDGKYFFYTSDKDIYWVDTEIFNQFK